MSSSPGLSTAGHEASPARVLLTDDDAIWFLCAIGRLPTQFEFVMLNMGQNPFNRKEYRRLKATPGPTVPLHHSRLQGDSTICAACGHWYRTHVKPDVIPPPLGADIQGGRDVRHWCYKHCSNFYCPDTGLTLENGDQPNCYCVHHYDQNLDTIARLAQHPDLQRPKAREILTRLKNQKETSPLTSDLLRRIRCKLKRHTASDLEIDRTAPAHLFNTICTRCQATVHSIEITNTRQITNTRSLPT